MVDSTGALELPKVPEAHGRDRRRRDRAGTGLGLAAARREGHRASNSSTRSCPAWTATSARKRARSSRSRASNSSSSTKVTGVSVKGKKATLTLEPAAGGDERDDGGRLRAGLDRPQAQHRRPGPRQRSAWKPTSAARSRSTTNSAPAVDGVWAIGDVIPGPMLAHKAEDEGIAVAEIHRRADRHREPRCDPQRRLHLARDRRRRPDRGSRRRRRGDKKRQGRQVPDDGQQPRQDQPRARRLREGHRRCRDRPRAGRVGHRLASPAR